MASASIPFQSAATLAIAIIGMVSTLLAGYLAHQKESAAERERWVRDRRIEPYTALTAEYRKALVYAEEAWSINRELAAIRETNARVIDELSVFQTELDDPARRAGVVALETRRNSLMREVEESGKRQEKFAWRAKRQEKDLRENVEQLEALFTPLQLLGSPRVRELSSDVQEEVTTMLAASGQIEKTPDAPLFARWEQLFEAMRRDLGMVAPRRFFRR
jgi:hypothetical protein